ncbi:hypothetical protein ACVIHD_006353 [Bradyrhizobium embrapense]
MNGGTRMATETRSGKNRFGECQPIDAIMAIDRLARSDPERVAGRRGRTHLQGAAIKIGCLARTLREHGAQGEVVGYWVSGTSTGRAVVAILKPASTYLPLDPSLPASRASFMIEQSRCALIIGPHQLDLLGLFQANGKGATQFMPMEAALRHRARLRLSCHHRTRTDSRTFCLRLARWASLRARNDRPRGPK